MDSRADTLSENQLHSVMENYKDKPTARIAVACPGVGVEQRGFERWINDLFHLLNRDLDLTLYKGGGTRKKNEKVLKFIKRNSWFAKHIPLHKLIRRTPIHIECLTFALVLLYYIRKDKIEILHCVDPPLARLLYKFRAFFKLDFKLLYTEGAGQPAPNYPPADHIHQVARLTYDEAREFGIPPHFLTLIPGGIYEDRFESTLTKEQLRSKYGVDQDTMVILSVAAINRGHKRIDYLINEFANLEGNILLWMDGSMDQGEPDLCLIAKQTLGDRCRITKVPSEDVGELYRLADLFVHTAVKESFGLAIVEAATTGTPLLVHDGPHFNWLIDNPACWSDMSQQGLLAQRLQEIISEPKILEKMGCKVSSRKRYLWKNLKSEYLDLYQHMANLQKEETGVAHRYQLK